MNSLKLDATSEGDGTVTFRLPRPGRFRVQIAATWEPLDVDRRAIFDEVRHHGHPEAIALLERIGEDAITNPQALLSYGALADDTSFDRPEQPKLDDVPEIE